MVNQPVLSHERDFSLGRRNGQGKGQGDMSDGSPQCPQPALHTPSLVLQPIPQSSPRASSAPGIQKRGDTVHEVALRYLSFPVSPRNRSSNCFMRPGETI